jgi:hypothetical protein
MPKWEKPSQKDIEDGKSDPVDVLLVGARGSVDWRKQVIPALDAMGLTWHDVNGIPVRSDRTPQIGCTLVGVGDPGAGNHGLDTMFVLGQRLSGGPFGDGGSLVVYRFGELDGNRFTPHDRDVYDSVMESLSRSRTHIASDPGEVARACAVHRAYRWNDDQVEVETITTTKRRAKRR